jgi:hypothetical protein
MSKGDSIMRSNEMVNRADIAREGLQMILPFELVLTSDHENIDDELETCRSEDDGGVEEDGVHGE